MSVIIKSTASYCIFKILITQLVRFDMGMKYPISINMTENYLDFIYKSALPNFTHDIIPHRYIF